MTDISLLPGWAMSAQSMQPLQQALAERLPQARIECMDLPPLQMSSLEPDLAALAERLRPGVLVGWSLGGMLAVQLLRRYPERFSAVVTLASNACFAARPDWPEAMPQAVFKDFYAAARQDQPRCLKRFALLVSQGSEQARSLSKAMPWDHADEEQRLHALALLAVLDNRRALSHSTVPMLHCLAAGDALVPVGVAPALQALNPGARIRINDQASHALPLEHPQWLAEQIGDFLAAEHD
ncbi:MAG: transporter [Gammaproteobacteria bacterium HGW-Gammaproteobacteria-11]|nr:MAG: transporter [Gammaproteobacteria bacterium HGW-Gammaproteobacteria-11]